MVPDGRPGGPASSSSADHSLSAPSSGLHDHQTRPSANPSTKAHEIATPVIAPAERPDEDEASDGVAAATMATGAPVTTLVCPRVLRDAVTVDCNADALAVTSATEVVPVPVPTAEYDTALRGDLSCTNDATHEDCGNVEVRSST